MSQTPAEQAARAALEAHRGTRYESTAFRALVDTEQDADAPAAKVPAGRVQGKLSDLLNRLKAA